MSIDEIYVSQFQTSLSSISCLYVQDKVNKVDMMLCAARCNLLIGLNHNIGHNARVIGGHRFHLSNLPSMLIATGLFSLGLASKTLKTFVTLVFLDHLGGQTLWLPKRW